MRLASGPQVSVRCSCHAENRAPASSPSNSKVHGAGPSDDSVYHASPSAPEEIDMERIESNRMCGRCTNQRV